jgi:glycosyltransferase involved in cell wall biosynthesis
MTSMKQTPITIGIPYRDEGQSFHLLAGGLAEAVRELDGTTSYEIIVCVNGSPEGFAEQLEEQVKVSPLGIHPVRIITSQEGKLAAQKAIVAARVLQGYLAFVDSDVVIGPNVLRCLWETLEAEPDCIVAYGQPVAIFPERGNWVHILLRAHYSLRERAYRRAHFHGRAFMMREWFLHPPTAPEKTHAFDGKRLRLHIGPLVDDIVLSRIAVAKWGPNVIREVQEANVFFDPPDTLRGLYAGHLRVALELKRLDMLYPEHAHLQDQVFRVPWQLDGIRRFSKRLKALHACYRCLDAMLRRMAHVHVGMMRKGWLNLETLWIRVPGTKSFARHRRSWRLFNHEAREPLPLQKP